MQTALSRISINSTKLYKHQDWVAWLTTWQIHTPKERHGLISRIDDPKMDWTRDNKQYDHFIQWQKRCKMIFCSALVDQTDQIKGEYLKYWMGTEGLQLIEKWENPGKLTYEGDAATSKNIDTYWTLLEDEFKPKANKIISIIELWNKSKQGSASLNEWIPRVYNMVDQCKYANDRDNFTDRIIRDVLIIRCGSSHTKDKIIRKGSAVSLKELLEILQTEESTTKTLSTIRADTQKIHYAIYDKKKSGSKGGKQKSGQPSTFKKPNSKPTDGPMCYRCGKTFTKEHDKVCKAKTAKNDSYQTVRHYSKCCIKTGKLKKSPNTRKQHIAGAHELEDMYYDEYGNVRTRSSQYMLSTQKGKHELIIEFGCGTDLDFMDQKIAMKINTGADMNAINKTTFKKLFPNTKLQPSIVILENFDLSYIQPMGKFKAFLCWKGKQYRVDIEVMDSNTTPNVLSRESAFCMGILKPCFMLKKSTGKEDTPSLTTDTPSRTMDKNHPQQLKQPRSPLPYNINGKVNLKKPLTELFIKSEFTEVFDRLGQFPGEPYKLKLKPDAIPAWHRPRKVPVHLEEAFHEEISRLCKINVLEPIKDHTEWVNLYVIVEKEVQIDSSNVHMPGHTIKKKLRIRQDPKDLNEALEWEPYYSRTVDELILKFYGAVFFTIIDLDKGYWQVILHPDSWKYTCMALDIGRFQWKRLPMGTIVASDVFQKKLDSIYIGLPGVTGNADDMIIYGTTEDEYDQNLLRFLQVTKDKGLRLSKDKIQFKKTEVSFFGHRWSKDGLSPDPKKIQSIINMDFPEDKETMHSFLGMVNFLNHYSPWLAELCTSLRSLILKDTHYIVTDKHRAAFTQLKQEFTTDITLSYFDRNKYTTLQTDALKKGFGTIILQDYKPIYFTSRSLTPAEKNYQNLEHECMAVIWGIEKFHFYLYSKEFLLQMDQRPLTSIFKKHMVDVSPRIRRIAIRSWPYTFKTEWIPGKDNAIADGLSRVSPVPVNLIESEIELPIHQVNINKATMEEEDVCELQWETASDPELQAVAKVISNGWPTLHKQAHPILHDYWNYQDELSIDNGILTKNDKIIIPKTLQWKFLDRIHSSHQGIQRSLQKAHEYIFWVNYTKHVKEVTEKCSLCQENSAALSTEKFKYISTVPPHPWHTLGMDLFYFRKQDFLVLIDYFSKFLIVRKLPNSTSNTVIKELGLIFTEFGKPFILCSDNRPCYVSQEFQFFMKDWNIKSITLSPYFHQSNGLAESMVKTSKNLIEKSLQLNKPWFYFLHKHSITPISENTPLPVEILFGWRMRSNLSIIPSQLMNPQKSK